MVVRVNLILNVVTVGDQLGAKTTGTSYKGLFQS